ncbi:Peptidyl-prolyl cis-trans isomerase PpiD [Fimbriiglobus ruber]|uniref:peptidylprolyl isomerase n=2 Tax=Fimbriiglobus ruber TaxID=1908690 RepID=A0A225E6W5_9BACT|nr:Peptidyl-prolyl cis-trans isomerase PpiD [Fimbriiglobus ruber]
MMRQQPEMSEIGRMTNPVERDVKERELFRKELRNLIERELILTDFVAKIKKQKPKVLDELNAETQKTAAKQLMSYRKEKGNISEAAFAEILKAQGLSYKGIVRQLERNAMLNIYLGQFFKDKEKAKGVTKAQIATYYDQHQEEFKIEDNVKWLDLFVSVHRFNNADDARKYADWLAKQAKDGTDFVELVKKFGFGDSKLRDGEGIGNQRGQISPPQLEPIVFATTAGQISDLVPTPNGFHIVKVVDRQVAGVRPLDKKLQDEIRARIATQLNKAEYDKLIEELWRRTTVKVVEE